MSPSADLSSKDYKQDDLVSSSIGVRFGSRLRELRKNRGWTQVRTAEELGIDRSYISDMERGKNRSVCRRWKFWPKASRFRWPSLSRGSIVSARAKGIPQGTYELKYTSGLDWQDEVHAFRWLPTYSQFGQQLVYSEKKLGDDIRYHEIKVTLQPVIGGNVPTLPISREEFLTGTAERD